MTDEENKKRRKTKGARCIVGEREFACILYIHTVYRVKGEITVLKRLKMEEKTE